MISSEILELAGKSIDKISVYSDAVLIALTDGTTAVAVFVEEKDGVLRAEVRSRGPTGAKSPSVRVYRGEVPYPGTLPEYARRR